MSAATQTAAVMTALPDPATGQACDRDARQGRACSSVRGIALRVAALAAILLGLGWLMADRLAEIDGAALAAALAAAPLGTLLLAACLSALSHAAVSLYDPVSAPLAGVGLPLARLVTGGFVGSTVGQVLGFGLATGSLARWRMYAGAGVSAGQAVVLSGLVTAGFCTGLAGLTALLVLGHPATAARITGLGAGGLALAAAACLLALMAATMAAGRGRCLRIGRRRVGLPGAVWVLRCTAVAAADVIPAAFALFVLMPAAHLPPLHDVVLVYLVALGAGLMTGAPGGIGLFETVLLLAFPTIPVTDLAASVLLYRVIYFGPAFVLALALLARGGRAEPRADAAVLPTHAAFLLDGGTRAEAALARLGDKCFHVAPAGDAVLMYGVQGRHWIVMGDPYGPPAAWGALMDSVETAARAAGARVAIYKADARSLAFWRARGHTIQPLGQEAVIVVHGFTLDGPERRELRRKLGQARKAGIVVRAYPPGAAPLAALTPVAVAWRAARRGREHTFSMGHFDPVLLAGHHVFAAEGAEGCCAFLSVWVSGDGREWMIDLMRQTDAAPSGTMHALIVAGIGAAQSAGADRFNLCMAPLSGLDSFGPATPLTRLGAALYRRGERWHGLAGLRRFKEAFRPDWQGRYLVADGPLHALAALRATHRLVTRPLPPITLRPEALLPPATDAAWDAGRTAAPPQRKAG